MFCEKCGAKNKKEAKFCENCGHKIEQKHSLKQTKKPNYLLEKFNSLSKKSKIIMCSVLIITIVAIITLCILLNNPVKKIEDYLISYYNNYSENANNKELLEIGKILKSNRKDEKVLNRIKTTTQNAMEKWVKNFNTEYKDSTELNEAYKKVSGALKDIYNYYNGLEYMLNKDLYSEYKDELVTMYYSKEAYLEGKNYESENNLYQAYYYYQKVDSKDCYYKKAQDFILEYVKEEITSLKEKANELITITEDSLIEEKLTAYLNKLKYLKDNKVVNKIDLSTTEEYQNIYQETVKTVIDTLKQVITELEKELKYNEIIDKITEVMNILNDNKNSNEYQELTNLKEEYQNKAPNSLLDYRTEYKGARHSKTSLKINGEEYQNSLSFSFDGETQYVTYRLNEEYKRLKTTIIRGENWGKDLNGVIVITGDGKELYRSDTISDNNEFQADIDIDITGVDELKIEFVTTSKSTGWTYFYIYLVEPYLYK